jgi:hypothetical protein
MVMVQVAASATPGRNARSMNKAVVARPLSVAMTRELAVRRETAYRSRRASTLEADLEHRHCHMADLRSPLPHHRCIAPRASRIEAVPIFPEAPPRCGFERPVNVPRNRGESDAR